MNYESYEGYFKKLGISEKEANVLIGYMSSLVEISIRLLNDNKIEQHETLCNMDEGVNQTSGR